MQLLDYFGEDDPEPCGICSVCISRHSKVSKTDFKRLKKDLILLLEHEDLSSENIISKLDFPETKIKMILKDLLEQDIIKVTRNNTYTLSHL